MRSVAIFVCAVVSFSWAPYAVAESGSAEYCRTPTTHGAVDSALGSTVVVDTMAFSGRQSVSAADAGMMSAIHLDTAVTCAIRLLTQLAGLRVSELRASSALCTILKSPGSGCTDSGRSSLRGADRVQECTLHVVRDKVTQRALSAYVMLIAIGGSVNAQGEKLIQHYEVHLALSSPAGTWSVVRYQKFTPE